MNYCVLTAIVCLISLQLTVCLGRVLMLFKPPDLLAVRLLPDWAGQVHPKWDVLLFCVFVFFAVAGQAMAMIAEGRRIQSLEWRRQALPYLCVEAGLTFLLLSAAFQATIYDNSPALAVRALVVVSAMALAVKLFWPEISGLSAKLGRLVLNMRLPIPAFAADAASLAAIGLVIYMPDLERVLAQTFIGEQFHHFDFFLMSPGWAYLNGQLPYVGVISQYGVGVPALLSKLAGAFGGFDYLPVLKMIVTLVVVYYMMLYGFVRWWLGSSVLAAAVFFVAFRLQMLHYGVSPLVWIYPSTTPVRFGLDVLWLGLLLAHVRTRRAGFLLAAALYSGAAVYYMTATGMCVAATFYFYLASLILVPHLRQIYFPDGRRLALAFAGGAAVMVSAVFLFWLTLGRWVWTAAFWHNMTEYLNFFAHGHGGGVLPIYESLKYRNTWASLMGFVLPLVYVFTLVFVGILLYLKKLRAEHLLAVVIAVYGLANYQYYVVRSAMTSYYMNGLPFVLLSAYWLDIVLKRLDPGWARRLRLGALLLSVYALTTNHNYISYPNLFNFSRNPMVDITVAQHFPDRQGYFNHQVKGMKEADKLSVNSLGQTQEDIRTEDSFKSDEELKEYFRQEFDFSQDARLIDSLTKPAQPAALLSSFETKILIQAKRPPFFYHLPLLTSQPMRMRAWPADAAHSPNFLADTLRQLDSRGPEYIFVEKVFLQDKIPSEYTENDPSVAVLVGYVRRHYVPVQEGKYLAALKRKD